MNFAKGLNKARNLAKRYLTTYPILLAPRSQEREKLLSRDYHKGMGPFVFFGITTSLASASYSALARYKIDDINLTPRWWQSVFELEILGVNLKNACVEFVNALILAFVAMILIHLVSEQIKYRKCMSAFLFAYAIMILVSTFFNLVSNAFLTAPDLVTPSIAQWALEEGTTTNLIGAVARQGFAGDRLFVAVPNHLNEMFLNQALYYVPTVVSIFNISGFSLTSYSSWDEKLTVITLLDLKVLLAVYILRLKVRAGAIVVIACSFIGYHVDAVVSRYTAKHVQLAYLSTRMQPSVQIGQAFRYSTTYFDNFPMKTGDLAVVDFWQCKWSRHPENRRFLNGQSYKSGDEIHFISTFTSCDEALQSAIFFLTPEYEIVRTIALAGQKVEINRKGGILVDSKPIADLIAEEDAEFKFTRWAGGPAEKPAWIEVPMQGKRFTYGYRRTRLPHETSMAAYLWDCEPCTDDKFVELEVPKGYFLAMFDYVARPRFMLIREQDVIGYPFLKATKRW